MRPEFIIFKMGARVNRYVRRLPPFLQVIAWAILGVCFAVVLAFLVVLNSIWGLLKRIWYRVFPRPLSRDVSRLDDSGNLEVVSEVVADEGELLKEHQHRRIYRDPRLLPKRKPAGGNLWVQPRRRKLMQADEASRLFSASFRCRDRRIRDLLADKDQLDRWNLPVWKTEKELAQALDISVKRLRHFSIHREADRIQHYVMFAIPKARGGQRVIMAPKQNLKRIQRVLLRTLVDKLPVSDYAHGFRAGRSTATGAAPHVNKAVVLKMDLQDFFPTVTFGRVRGYLVSMGYSFPVATTLAMLMTEAERQPVQRDGGLVYTPVGQRYCVQGAPTSPGLCNSICRRLDHRLAGLAEKYGWTFTRYADDLTFSGDAAQQTHTIRRVTQEVCREEGFQVHPEKTSIMRRGSRQSVTGVIVNEVPGLSRQERRRLRAVIHRLQLNDPDRPASMSPGALSGHLAYLHMLNRDQARALQQRWDAGEQRTP